MSLKGGIVREPEWDWYDNTDLKIGEARHDVHHFLFDEEYEEYLEEIKAKERRRIKPGFNVQDSKRPVRKQRPTKKNG